jgi:cytochrome c oxidase assembly protein subunit 15
MGRQRLSFILVGLTFLLIFWGGQVTTTLSGDSVPSWPSSFFIPADAAQVWELGHRWIAGVVGLVTVGLAIWILARDRRALPRRLGVAAAVLVIVQALVGGVRVRLGETHSNVWPIVHTLLAQGFLACVIALSVSLRHDEPQAEGTRWARRRAFALAVVTWLQAGLGAVLRHETQDRDRLGLVLHLSGAMLVIIFAIRLLAPIHEQATQNARLRWPARLIAAGLAGQLILGLSAWVTTHTAEGYVNPTDVRSLVPTLHLVLGSAILALAVMMGMRETPTGSQCATDRRLWPGFGRVGRHGTSAD